MQLFFVITHFVSILPLFLTAQALSYGGESEEKTISVCKSMKSEHLTLPGHFMKANVSQKFRVAVKDVNCPGNSTVLFMQSTPAEPLFHFFSSGVVEVPDVEYFLQDEYCVSRVDEFVIEIKHCEVKCGETHTCIQKCCPPDYVIEYSSTQIKCATSGNTVWKPSFYDHYSGCGIRSSGDVKFHLKVANLHQGDIIPYKHIMIFDEEINMTRKEEGARFRLMRKGNLVFQDGIGKWKEMHNEAFCIDGMMSSVGNFSGKVDDQIFYLFHEAEDKDAFEEEIIWSSQTFNDSNGTYFFDEEIQVNAKQIGIVTLFIIGAIFLLLTAILYLLIWEKHNIHGWTIFSFVITMFCMFLFVGLSHLFSISVTSEFAENPGCKTVGVLAHFFYLSTICWLTVINLDLWLTFRNVKPTGGPNKHLNQFVLYFLFAFGIPLIIVGFAVIADSVYYGAFGDGSECEPPIILPLYGQHQCYIQSYAETYYLHIPMAILLSCNILTFSSTVFTLCLYRNQTRNAVSGSTSHQKESLILFSKLFVVTGVSWVLEVLSKIFEEPQWLWIIFDSYNLLQAVLIFIIFACKRENLAFLYGKYPRARFLLRPIMRTKCCYIETSNSEQTEITGVAMDRNSRVHFRRGSNQSTTAMASSSSS